MEIVYEKLNERVQDLRLEKNQTDYKLFSLSFLLEIPVKIP